MNRQSVIKSLIMICIVAIIFIVVFYFSNKKQQQDIIVPPVLTNPNAITYYCQEGVMNAVYGKDSVDLSLQDGRDITLTQTMSGSGIRYELGNIILSSKGNNALLTENDKTTYTNCVSGVQITDAGINTYKDSSKTFSFSYPNQFILSGGDIGYSQNWRTNTTTLGLLLNVVTIPKLFLPNTNFSQAKFTVGTSADPNAIKNCLLSESGLPATMETVTIGGRNFTKVISTDAGAGNYYDTTSYRTVYNDQCYAIEYTIHSTNIYNYSPDQGIKEFDQTKIRPILENIVQSFRFL